MSLWWALIPFKIMYKVPKTYTCPKCGKDFVRLVGCIIVEGDLVPTCPNCGHTDYVYKFKVS